MKLFNFIMKILMLGWEFPPQNSGGLGIATYGLADALGRRGVNVNIILPYKSDYIRGAFTPHFVDKDLPKSHVKKRVTSPYNTVHRQFQKDVFNYVDRFTRGALNVAKNLDFDIIHVHDWLTLPAGVALKQAYGKPLISHLHTIELDRSADQPPNPKIFDVEKHFLPQADLNIAVSQFTKDRALQCYPLDEQKIHVVHNGHSDFSFLGTPTGQRVALKNRKIVLFVGRLTMHKGADYFIKAAAKVLAHEPNALFVLAGSGEAREGLMDLAAELDIADRVLFAGFLRGDQLKNLYRRARVYVMPSVAEPFGLAPLEALGQKTPIIVSKRAGVTEVMPHMRQVDFWDTDVLASQIIEFMRYPALTHTLTRNGYHTLKNITWDKAAKKVIDIYAQLAPSY